MCSCPSVYYILCIIPSSFFLLLRVSRWVYFALKMTKTKWWYSKGRGLFWDTTIESAARTEDVCFPDRESNMYLQNRSHDVTCSINSHQLLTHPYCWPSATNHNCESSLRIIFQWVDIRQSIVFMGFAYLCFKVVFLIPVLCLKTSRDSFQILCS